MVDKWFWVTTPCEESKQEISPPYLVLLLPFVMHAVKCMCSKQVLKSDTCETLAVFQITGSLSRSEPPFATFFPTGSWGQQRGRLFRRPSSANYRRRVFFPFSLLSVMVLFCRMLESLPAYSNTLIWEFVCLRGESLLPSFKKTRIERFKRPRQGTTATKKYLNI